MQEGILASVLARQGQTLQWLRVLPSPIVAGVDDQRREFKRTFASALLALRVEADAGTQASLAPRVATSVATYRRWEDPDWPNLPDAFQLNRLCEILGCEPDELVRPAALTPRERELIRRVGRGRRRDGKDGREHDQPPQQRRLRGSA